MNPQLTACEDISGKLNANIDPCARSPIRMVSVLTENELRMMEEDLFRNYEERIMMNSGVVFGFLNFNEMEEYTFICCLPITTQRNGLQTSGLELLVLGSNHIEKQEHELNLSNWEGMGFQAMFLNIVPN